MSLIKKIDVEAHFAPGGARARPWPTGNAPGRETAVRRRDGWRECGCFGFQRRFLARAYPSERACGFVEVTLDVSRIVQFALSRSEGSIFSRRHFLGLSVSLHA